jgi:hypothetical protein
MLFTCKTAEAAQNFTTILKTQSFLKTFFILAKSLISPLNKNMHPCSKLSFLYSSRNTAF